MREKNNLFFTSLHNTHDRRKWNIGNQYNSTSSELEKPIEKSHL